jgi:hypothetical protein
MLLAVESPRIWLISSSKITVGKYREQYLALSANLTTRSDILTACMLSPDIGRALQHAVAQANELYTEPSLTVAKDREKKRKRERNTDDIPSGAGTSKRKRKNKVSSKTILCKCCYVYI